MRSVILGLCLALILSSSARSQEREPASQSQVESLTKRIVELEQRNADLLKLIQRLEGSLRVQAHRAPTDSPDVELMDRVPGRWLMHPTVGIPVYAKNEFIVTSVGGMKVIEIVRRSGKPVPIDAVYFGETPAAAAPARAGATLNFGGQ